LPVDLVKENYAIISKAEVVSLHEPTDEFKETYLGFLEETQSQKEIGEEDQDDFNNLLLSLTELKHSKVH
jgi:hypothetical protein